MGQTRLECCNDVVVYGDLVNVCKSIFLELYQLFSLVLNLTILC